MKKGLFFLVVLIASFAVFAMGGGESAKEINDTKIEINETGFPIVNKPLTMTVFGIRDANQAPWKDILVFKEYEKKTGIHMDWQEIPDQGKEEKKSLLFASNDLPDVFVRPIFSRNEITMYGVESGQLMPLNDLIEKYAPNFMKLCNENPDILRSITSSDGNIYALPQVDTSNTGKIGFKQWINKEWLEKLGLEAPETTDELIEVLRAFKTQDPNSNGKADEIPLGLREVSAVYTTLSGSFGLHWFMENAINIEDGKIHFWLKDAEFKEYLQFLNRLYSEGLLWADFYKRDLPQWRSNLSNALFGVFMMPYSDVFLAVENQFEGLVPLSGPYGDRFWPDSKSGIESNSLAFALSNTCRNPEAAIRWVDYFYSDEGSLFFRYGIEGETYYIDENGNPQIYDSILNDPRGFMTALGEINLVPGGLNPCQITSQTEGIVASEITKKVAEEMIPYADKSIMPPSFSAEETEEILAINQDLDKYRDESVSRFILGEYSFDMWDEYAATLDKIGLSRLEEIYQQAYDRMMSM